jgi:cytidylate kinase
LNIVVSGYTAAGKTTHTRLLAQAMGWQYISAAEILLEKLGLDTSVSSESEIWFYHNDEINRLRRGTGIDDELDRFLLSRASSGNHIVFDARFLPWLSNAPMVRVWLASDLLSRARKCCVSIGKEGSAVPDCARAIHDKDHGDVERMAQAHDIVFSSDRSVFDVILDNSAFISAATAECSSVGIQRFHPYMLAAVQAAMGNASMLSELRRGRGAECADTVRFVRRVGIRLSVSGEAGTQ